MRIPCAYEEVLVFLNGVETALSLQEGVLVLMVVRGMELEVRSLTGGDVAADNGGEPIGARVCFETVKITKADRQRTKLQSEN